MKRAFTLIELLVVIAIIAILAAILFPVFAQAKLAAKKTVSLSNVKELDLGVQMYMGDADDTFPQSEYGNDDNHVTWATAIYPYLKSGDKKVSAKGVDQVFAQEGIFRSPGNPRPITPGVSGPGTYTYGVHHGLFVDNYGNQGGPSNPGVSASAVANPADLIALMEKGANYQGWNFPWFMDWQQQWVGAICKTAGDPSTVYRDGDDSVNPNWSGYTPNFDSDCSSDAAQGKWECAAHARYRYTQTAPMAFADGHARAMKKGSVQWFKNIWLDRRNINTAPNNNYGYENDGGWGFPGIH